MPTMKVNLLLNPANGSWIIQKMAENLARDLVVMGVDARVSDTPDESADVVHHMSWAFANMRTAAPSTMLITHLDDIYKLNQVRSSLSSFVNVGISMSNDTMQQLLAHGCAANSLCFIGPAHDGLIKPRRIVVGITSRIYPDGRKRESVLLDVAASMDLSAFEFRIFGKGWKSTIQQLESAGALVNYFGETDDYRQDYITLQAAIPHFDYYLYLGMDEGSLGTLDALSAGVATIITPQGFHLDLMQGITHPVVTAEDLRKVLTDIAAPRTARIASVIDLTWKIYAERHLAIWQAILNKQNLPRPVSTAVGPVSQQMQLNALRSKTIAKNSLNLRRMASAVSHWPVLRRLKQAVERFRSAK